MCTHHRPRIFIFRMYRIYAFWYCYVHMNTKMYIHSYVHTDNRARANKCISYTPSSPGLVRVLGSRTEAASCEWDKVHAVNVVGSLYVEGRRQVKAQNWQFALVILGGNRTKTFLPRVFDMCVLCMYFVYHIMDIRMDPFDWTNYACMHACMPVSVCTFVCFWCLHECTVCLCVCVVIYAPVATYSARDQCNLTSRETRCRDTRHSICSGEHEFTRVCWGP